MSTYKYTSIWVSFTFNLEAAISFTNFNLPVTLFQVTLENVDTLINRTLGLTHN